MLSKLKKLFRKLKRSNEENEKGALENVIVEVKTSKLKCKDFGLSSKSVSEVKTSRTQPIEEQNLCEDQAYDVLNSPKLDSLLSNVSEVNTSTLKTNEVKTSKSNSFETDFDLCENTTMQIKSVPNYEVKTSSFENIKTSENILNTKHFSREINSSKCEVSAKKKDLWQNNSQFVEGDTSNEHFHFVDEESDVSKECYSCIIEDYIKSENDSIFDNNDSEFELPELDESDNSCYSCTSVDYNKSENSFMFEHSYSEFDVPHLCDQSFDSEEDNDYKNAQKLVGGTRKKTPIKLKSTKKFHVDDQDIDFDFVDENENESDDVSDFDVQEIEEVALINCLNRAQDMAFLYARLFRDNEQDVFSFWVLFLFFLKF